MFKTKKLLSDEMKHFSLDYVELHMILIFCNIGSFCVFCSLFNLFGTIYDVIKIRLSEYQQNAISVINISRLNIMLTSTKEK